MEILDDGAGSANWLGHEGETSHDDSTPPCRGGRGRAGARPRRRRRVGGRADLGAGPAEWRGDLTPITEADWSFDRAEHLLGRAGFSGTPEDIRKLADMTPEEAVRSLVDYDDIPNDHLPPFEHSGSGTRGCSIFRRAGPPPPSWG